jgi:hypothetical protein
MKHSYSFTLILLPLAMLLALASTLFIQRTGIRYQVSSRYAPLNILPQENVEVANFYPDKPVEALVLYDSQNLDKQIVIYEDNLFATLDSMRVKYDKYDTNSPEIIDFSKYQTVVIGTSDLSKVNSQILDIMDWVENGGKVLFAVRPDASTSFGSIYRKLGIITKVDTLVSVKSIEFLTDLLPGVKGKSFGSNFMNGESFPVQLENNCQVHIVSADSNKTPILWVCDHGAGRVVFINTDQFAGKSERGVLGAAYSLLYDVFVYPVINSSVFFIDDFPAPFPEGSNELILKQYSMETKNFYINVWWPDMQAIARKYDIGYTGGMIETYTDTVTPPLEKQLDTETHKYFGGSLLADGGEIIFHGHNHVPLCTADNDVNKLNDYPAWPNQEAAQLAVNELFTFGTALFPNYNFAGYIPPSNILCSDSRRWLPLVVPGLKFISSVYLPQEGGQQYVQEFTEASDGIIELPRVISGYDVDEYQYWAAANELSLHYINSHFNHPDDVLDLERGAQKGWVYLRDKYDAFMKWLEDTAPGLRNMTGIEGAMAVQRFARLAMETQYNNGTLEISLGNFYDEAWLMLRSAKKPLSIDGGSITPVTSDLYLVKASKSKITISFGE